jgi:hypothetical protein
MIQETLNVGPELLNALRKDKFEVVKSAEPVARPG